MMIPDHLKALYERPTNQNFDDLDKLTWAESTVYHRHIERAKRLKPEPWPFEVAKVTDRFVYVWDTNKEHTRRLDRAKLEAGEGLSFGYIHTLYTWEAVKEKWEKFSAWWDKSLQEIIERVDQEYQEAEALGFKCQDCGKKGERLSHPAYQKDNDLSLHEGRYLCTTCRRAIFNRHFDQQFNSGITIRRF